LFLNIQKIRQITTIELFDCVHSITGFEFVHLFSKMEYSFTMIVYAVCRYPDKEGLLRWNRGSLGALPQSEILIVSKLAEIPLKSTEILTFSHTAWVTNLEKQ